MAALEPTPDPKPRRSLMRWGVIGCGGILALLGVIAIILLTIILLAACLGDEDDVRVAFEVGSSGTVETTNDERTRVTIDAIDDPALSSVATAEPGRHYLRITLTIENAGERETSPGNFILRMTDGFEYRPIFVPGLDTDSNYRQRLTSGGRTATVIAFEVPDGSVIEWLKFDPKPLAKGDLYFDNEP